MNKIKAVILASKSPRRRELLKLTGLKFVVFPSEEEEKANDDLSPQQYVMELAKIKGESVFKKTGGLVISADTIVVKDGKVLGKPQDSSDAFLMLSQLSDAWHEVYTGLYIKDADRFVNCYECTNVKFRKLTQIDIKQYIDTGDPLDKAGAYGIQSCGKRFVETMVGDYFNVVGLPVSLLMNILSDDFKISLNQ